MKNVLAITLAVSALGAMVWVMWTFKWWIIGGFTVLVLGNMGIEAITKKKTWLTRYVERQENKK